MSLLTASLDKKMNSLKTPPEDLFTSKHLSSTIWHEIKMDGTRLKRQIYKLIILIVPNLLPRLKNDLKEGH